MPKQKFLSLGTTSSAGTVYTNICAFSGSSVSIEPVPPLGLAGNFRKMYIKLASDPDSGGSSNGYTFTLRKNKVNTTVACSILSSTASFQNSYTGATVHFAATDTVSLAITKSGTPANSPAFSLIIEFEADAEDGSTALMSGPHGNLSTSATTYALIAGEESQQATEGVVNVVIPMTGTITSFSANVVVAPGGTATRTFTLRQNASSVGTAISYTSATSGVHTQAQSISVSQGDRVTILCAAANSPTTSTGGFSIVFQPTTTGQFIIPANVSGTIPNSVTNYTGIGATNSANATSESLTCQNIATADFSLGGWTAYLLNTPGGGAKKWTLSLRENSGAAPTTYSTDMTTVGPVTSASTVYTIPTNYNIYDTAITPVSSPTVSRIAISYIGILSGSTVVNLNDSILIKDASNIRNIGKLSIESITITGLFTKKPIKHLPDSVTILDQTLTKGTNKTLNDSITILDQIILKSIVKKLLEDVSISDTIKKSIIKELFGDSFIVSDTTSSRYIDKKLSGSIIIEDIFAKAPSKRLRDSIIVVDTLIKSVIKKLLERLIVEDFLTKSGGKPLLESIIISDHVLRRQIIKKLLEQVTLLDTILIIFNTIVTLLEKIVLTDTVYKKITKPFNELIALIAQVYPQRNIIIISKIVGRWLGGW